MANEKALRAPRAVLTSLGLLALYVVTVALLIGYLGWTIQILWGAR